jgi:hypothetical protein
VTAADWPPSADRAPRMPFLQAVERDPFDDQPACHERHVDGARDHGELTIKPAHRASRRSVSAEPNEAIQWLKMK